MRAARWHGRGDIRVDDVPQPGDPPPGWIRAKVEVCGICGTDLEEYLRGPAFIPLEPNPLTGRHAPLTLGHEIVGVVDAVGDGVSLEAGTPVAIETNVFCGHCYWCTRGQYPLCADLTPLGLRTDGGLAEYVLAPAYMCIPYASHVDPELMALAEPLAVAVRAVRRGGVTDGSVVGIIGAGTIGLLIAQVSRLAGAATIIAVDDHTPRAQLALQLGADQVATSSTAADVIAAATAGVGADICFEAAGSAQAAGAAITHARKGGRAVLLGVYDDIVGIDMIPFLLGEKEIHASLSHVYDQDFTEAVRMIERGQVDVRPLITHRIGLDDVVTHGFDVLVHDGANALKILVQPDRDGADVDAAD